MPQMDGKGPEGKGCGTGGKQGRLAGNTTVKEENRILNFFKRGRGRSIGPQDGRGRGRNRKGGE